MTYRRAARIGVMVGAALIVAAIGLRLLDRVVLWRNYESLSDLSSYVASGIFPGIVLIDIGPFIGVGVLGGLGCLSLLIYRGIVAVSRMV